MFRSITNNTSKNFSAGGTISGDVTIDGDLTVNGDGSYAYSEVITGDVQIIGANGTVSGTADADGNEFIIRNNNDAGMSILAGESSGYTSSIIFGSANDLNGANLFWEYHTKTLKIGTQDASGSGILKLRSGNGTDALTIGSDQSATFSQSVDGDAYIALDNVAGAGSSVNETAALRLNLGDGSTVRGGAKITAKKEADYSTGANMDASLMFSVLQNNAFNDALFLTSAGRIGIGESEPDRILHIKSGTPAIKLEDTATGNGAIGFIEFYATTTMMGSFGFGSTGNSDIDLLNAVSGGHIDYTTTGTSSQHRFLTNESTTNFIIDNNSRISLSNNDASGAVGTTLFGYNAGLNIVSGAVSNTFIGHEVADATLTNGADYNTGVGGSALSALTSGYSNAAFGFQSLFTNTDGFQNTAIGTSALYHNAGTDNNTAVGDQAGFYTTGANNTYVGQSAGRGASGAETHNTGVGWQALKSITTGDFNVALGSRSGEDLSVGSLNTFVGDFAGHTTTSATRTVAIGHSSMASALVTADAIGTVAIGYEALNLLTSGDKNLAIGYQAMGLMQTGTNNIALGYNSMDALQGGDGSGGVAASANGGNHNIAIGTDAMGSVEGYRSTTEIDGNIAIGTNALLGGDLLNNNIDFVGNIAIGYNAVDATGDAQGMTGTIGIGHEALSSLTSGARNTAVGFQAMDELTTGEDNVAFGYGALGGASTSSENKRNVAIGNSSMSGTNAGASENVAIGYAALDANLTSAADGNTGVGYQSLTAVTSGTKNTAVGADSGGVLSTGDYNTIIGHTAAPSASGGENQIVIGYHVTGKGNDTVTLGNGDVTDVYMAEDVGATVHCAGLGDGTDTLIALHTSNHIQLNGAGIQDTGNPGFTFLNDASLGSQLEHVAGNTGGDIAVFRTTGGIAGKITTSGTSTAFTTSSDYRLKENEVTMPDALTRLGKLKPYRFNWKSDKDTTVDGFFAHEVAEVVPEAIVGSKDAVDDKGEINPQGIDQSKLVPLLVKAVQELSAKVTELEAKL